MSDDYRSGFDGLARPPGGNYSEFNQGKNDRALQDQRERQRQTDPFSPVSPPPTYQSGGNEVANLKNGAWWIIAVGVGFLIFGATNGGGGRNASLDSFMGGLFVIIGLIVIVTGVVGLILRNSGR